jgi:hypothetical protein
VTKSRSTGGVSRHASTPNIVTRAAARGILADSLASSPPRCRRM